MKVLVKNLHNEKVDLFRSVLAEFVGTAILVIFTCGTCMSTSINNSGDALVCTAVSFGFTVACLVAALGHVSGCHINPAVTVGLLANGKCTLLKAAIYIASQLLGGIAGASLLYALLPDPGNLCSTVLIKVTPLQGIIVEALICFLLVFVICNVCESNASNAPLLIGLAVTTGHLFAIPLTCSSMNTARSFGPAVISNTWANHYVYWIGPLVGGALGGLFHRFIFINKNMYDECQLKEVHGNDQSNATTAI